VYSPCVLASSLRIATPIFAWALFRDIADAILFPKWWSSLAIAPPREEIPMLEHFAMALAAHGAYAGLEAAFRYVATPTR
jgi:hypothetical protein